MRAELIGSNKIIFDGQSYTSYTPVLSLCSELASKGIKGKLSVYRGSTLALTADVEKAAKLRISDTRFYLK